MTKMFQDMMTGLEEVDAYLANNHAPKDHTVAQALSSSFRSAEEEYAFEIAATSRRSRKIMKRGAES
jgi:hypothetical protein